MSATTPETLDTARHEACPLDAGGVGRPRSLTVTDMSTPMSTDDLAGPSSLRILYGIDGSPEAEAALDVVAWLGQAPGTSVCVVSIAPPSGYQPELTDDDDPRLEGAFARLIVDERRHLQERTADLATRLRDRGVAVDALST